MGHEFQCNLYAEHFRQSGISRYRPGFPRVGNGVGPGGAFYGQWDHQLLDTVKLVGGFQFNKVDTIAVNAVPRIGMIWNPTSHVGVKALYSGAFRAASINETGLNHPALEGTPG